MASAIRLKSYGIDDAQGSCSAVDQNVKSTQRSNDRRAQRDPRAAKDYGLGGFFQLRFPQDLFAKMRYDYERMKREPMNVYPAFDFFVTANHLVDWIWPSAGREQLKKNRAEHAIPRICEHIANGAKHFLLTAPHNAVAGLKATHGAFDPAAFDSNAFDTSGLFIDLKPDEAAAFGAERITAIDLAQRVLEYWEGRGVAK